MIKARNRRSLQHIYLTKCNVQHVLGNVEHVEGAKIFWEPLESNNLSKICRESSTCSTFPRNCELCCKFCNTNMFNLFLFRTLFGKCARNRGDAEHVALLTPSPLAQIFLGKSNIFNVSNVSEEMLNIALFQPVVGNNSSTHPLFQSFLVKICSKHGDC